MLIDFMTAVALIVGGEEAGNAAIVRIAGTESREIGSPENFSSRNNEIH